MQKEEIDKTDGTLNMVAQIILRIFKMEFPVEIIANLQNRTDEELFIDAGYEPEVFGKLKEIKEMIRLMEEFKARNYPQNDFSKPYFFRNFLDCEFHGTGRTITKLGLIRAFKLLWMTVIPADSRKINFNPLPTGKELVSKIKINLDRLSVDDLTLEYLEAVKDELRAKRSCYIYATGFHLEVIAAAGTLEVRYEDIDENINKMIDLLRSIKGKKISKIKIDVLQDIESLFRTVDGYSGVYERETSRLKKIGGMEKKIAYMEKKGKEIITIHDKISHFFSKGIFPPTEVYTNLKLLFDNCPSILNLTLKEFWEYGQIKIKRREHIEPASNYILRCMKKYQAVAAGNMAEFQNTEAFYNLCRKEFGDISRQTIGLHPSQLSLPVNLYRGLSGNYREALAIALTLQDVGKIPRHIIRYKTQIDFSNHAVAGAWVLRKEKSIFRLAGSPDVAEKSLFLIAHHGLIGQIIKGEDPLEVIKPVTDLKDPQMLDAFFLHCVIAAAAFREDLMTYDLFEKFLTIYQTALRVLKGEVSWEDIHQASRQKFSWEIQAAREPVSKDKVKSSTKKTKDAPREESTGKDWSPGDEAMAMHRLFRLTGSPDVRYTEVLRCEANSELTWKYFHRRERTFRSLGPRSFESQFVNAQQIYADFKKLPAHLQKKTISYFSGQKGPIRFFFMDRAAGQISRNNCLKFLLWIVSAFEYRNNQPRFRHDSPYLDLSNLSNIIDDRKSLINQEIDRMSFEDFESASWISSFLGPKRGLRFKINLTHGSIHFFFIDLVDISRDIREMRNIVNINELNRFYRQWLLLLSNDPSIFKDQIRLFARHYRRCLKEVKLLAVKRLQARMESIAEKILEGKLEFTNLKKVYEKSIGARIFEDQHLRLLRDKYEYTMGRLRDDMVQNMISGIYTARNLSQLEKHYIEIINFMKSHQPFFQKELQKHLLNQYLDRKNYFNTLKS
jgi:hypothetical protein